MSAGVFYFEPPCIYSIQGLATNLSEFYRVIACQLMVAGLSRLSICLFVVFWLRTWKLKTTLKPKLVWTFSEAGVTGVSVFSLKG